MDYRHVADGVDALLTGFHTCNTSARSLYIGVLESAQIAYFTTHISILRRLKPAIATPTQLFGFWIWIYDAPNVVEHFV
jgi:hypothetical protein